jgi:hypothetical protein
MGTSSAAVGGGAPAGRIGGGPPAGAVGGGAPGSANPQGNGAAGAGNPGVNAVGTTAVPSDNPASGLEGAPTTGGVIGGSIGVPPATVGRGAALPVASQSQPATTGQSQPTNATASKAVEGVAEQPPPSTVGLAEPGPDGVSTKIVAPRPAAWRPTKRTGQPPAWDYPLGDRRRDQAFRYARPYVENEAVKSETPVDAHGSDLDLIRRCVGSAGAETGLASDN